MGKNLIWYLWYGKIIVLLSPNQFTMAQVTLSVPNEKLPVLNDFLNVMGIQNKNVKTKAYKYSYKKMSGSVKNSANNLFKKYFTWEYFSNELEFE